MSGPTTLAPVLAVSTLAAAASLAGVALVHLRPAWSRASALPLAAIAGGAILGAAFLDVLPEAIDRAGASACDWALASFFALYVLETHVVRHDHHHHHGHGHEEARDAAARHAMIPGEAHAAIAHDAASPAPSAMAGAAAPLAWVGGLAFALHSAFDGLALGIGYSPDVHLGAAATMGVLAHKIPEGVALAALLLGRVAPGRAIVIATAIALLTPAAAVASWSILGGVISPVAFGRLLGLVAGSFVYVAAADLLPEVAAHPRLSRTLLMLGGIGLALAVRAL